MWFLWKFVNTICNAKLAVTDAIPPSGCGPWVVHWGCSHLLHILIVFKSFLMVSVLPVLTPPSLPPNHSGPATREFQSSISVVVCRASFTNSSRILCHDAELWSSPSGSGNKKSYIPPKWLTCPFENAITSHFLTFNFKKLSFTPR